jgi:dolichyl-phosphate-mannose--protein O-mannosyl transferase
MLALALSTKWSALWLIILFLILEFIKIVKKKNWQKLPFVLFSLVFTPLLVYLLIFLPYFLDGKTLVDFFQLQKQIIHFHFNWSSPHPYQSGPVAWIFNWRPVWYFADFSQIKWRRDIFAQGNPVLFLYFWFLPVFLWWWQQRLKSQKAIKKWREILFQPHYFLLAAFFACSFLPWLFFQRPMFFYHFLPALPYLILLITWPVYLFILTIKDKGLKQAFIFNFLFWPILLALVFYPHWTALPVPELAANLLYFLLPSWR